MRRRDFLTAVAGTTVGGLAGAGQLRAAAPQPTNPRAPLLTTDPMVWAPRADGAEILWTVSRLARGWVELRSESGRLERVNADAHGFVPQSDGVMRVRVAGLEPGAVREWRVVIEAIDGEPERHETGWKRLRTLDPTAASTRFCVWNDTHENAETIRRLQAVTPAADFLLWNGDTCNDWHEPEMLAPILMSPGGTDISEGHPLLLTLGNHDIRGKHAFRLPHHVAMPDGRPYYGFRSGPVAVVALFTGEDKPDDHPSFQGRVASRVLREEQRDWLDDVLARPEFAGAPYRVVLCHIPLRWLEEPETVDYAGTGFDRYARSSRDLWHDALTRWGAQVVISGHTHRHAFIPGDTAFPYAQVTGGGPRLDQATWMNIEADPREMRLRVARAEGGEALLDQSFSPLT